MNNVDFKGQTALVTGASSGIGAEFARALAARGANVVLVARRMERLEALGAEIAKVHGVVATPIALDLSVPGAGAALYAAVTDRGIMVTSLINNAGFGTDGPFHEEDRVRLAEEINVDVGNLVDITHAFIGDLRSSGTGVLVNVASMAAYTPIPGMGVYAACKAFVLNFTEALWHESRSTGLRVLSLAPGATRTEFFDVLGGGAYDTSYQTPEQVVTAALRALDRGSRKPSVTTRPVNGVIVALGRLLTRKQSVRAAAAVAASATKSKRTPDTATPHRRSQPTRLDVAHDPTTPR